MTDPRNRGEEPSSEAPPNDETRVDWPVAGGPPPPSVDELPELPDLPPAVTVPPPAPPPPAPPPPGPAPSPWAPATPQGPWAAAPVAMSRYSVPGAPGLEFAGATARVVAYIIDGIIVTILTVVALTLVAIVLPGLLDTPVVASVVGVAIDAAYFIGLWSGGNRATLGMRLLKLQVGNASDGRRMDGSQALRRWILLGSWLTLVGVTPALSGIAGLAALVWALVLLASTATSPTKQGIHDRVAHTAVVRPIGSSSGAVVLGCILIIVLGFLLSLVALIFLGSQVSSILSAAGESVAP